MKFLSDDKPIIACSSGLSERTAVSVIRISGFISIEQFNGSLKPVFGKVLIPRKAQLVQVMEDSLVLDEALLLFFPAPKSYTGENVLELHVHGNPINVNRIINSFRDKFGLRIASPGEFSYRALKNKKKSLLEIEAIDLLLNSNSHYGLDEANRLLNSPEKTEFHELYKGYVNVRAHLEILFDFSEDVGEAEGYSSFLQAFQKFLKLITQYRNRIQHSQYDINNPSICLFGDVNAGKSSLFNNLLGRKRAIVSELAGTTRDFLTEGITFQGTRFNLIDTAGIRSSNEVIESIGIELGLEQISKAFFKIMVVNGGAISSREVISYLDKWSSDLGHFDLVVFTHMDKFLKEDLSESVSGKYEVLFINNLANSSHEDVLGILQAAQEKFKSITAVRPIIVPRHLEILKNVSNMVKEFESLLIAQKDVAILASELYLIGQNLEELIGVVTPDNILDHVFQNFCIGK